MILTNAHLIFPDGIRDGLELVVEKGKITAIRERIQAHASEVLDLYGNYLAPGFIDLHVHGARGRDTMEAHAEAFRFICGYHASGGSTSLLLTTATAPFDSVIDAITAARDALTTVKQIAGVHVEGAYI